MKKLLIISCALLGALLFWFLPGGVSAPNTQVESSDALDISKAGKGTSVALPVAKRALSAASSSSNEHASSALLEAAKAHLELRRNLLGIAPYHEMRPEMVETPLGAICKFTPYQANVPIVGMQVEIRVGLDGKVRELRSSYRSIPEVDLRQTGLKAEEILAVTRRFEAVSNSESARVIYVGRNAAAGVPAIAMTVRKLGASEIPVQAVFRASDGQVLDLTVPRGEFSNR